MSSNFDLHQTQQASTIIDNKWIPQPSSNLFKPPQILEVVPIQGQENDNFRIDIQQSSVAVDINSLKIAFNTCFTNCQCSVNTVTQLFSIHTQVPSSTLVSCNDLSRVPIYLAVVQQHNVLDSWFIGYFSYYSRKRSSSDFDTDEAKRARSDQQQSFSLGYPSSSAAYYGIPSHVPYVGLPPTQPSPRAREYFEDPLLYNPAAGSSTDYRTSDQFLNDPNFMPSTSSNTQEPFMMPMMENLPNTSQQPVLASPSNASSSNAPPLQIKPIQPSQPPQPQPPPQTSPTPANVYANALNKPNLNIEGDLNSMMRDWSTEEISNQRRLVQFWRREEGNEIFSQFKSFDIPSQKVDYSKMIIVSCIYWKEKDDYFITSVDCIYLLEKLLGVTFTVEEKNRIRRNLEGYKPLTVSKLKPESTEFFKLIMGFPNPKPRNIEKDLKVFHWETLAVALKKIISKYTPSYSSTLTVNVSSPTQSTSQQGNSPQVQPSPQ